MDLDRGGNRGSWNDHALINLGCLTQNAQIFLLKLEEPFLSWTSEIPIKVPTVSQMVDHRDLVSIAGI